jgi:hypothetical protein
MHHQGQWSASQRHQQQTHQLLLRSKCPAMLQQQVLLIMPQQLSVMVVVVRGRDWTQQQQWSMQHLQHQHLRPCRKMQEQQLHAWQQQQWLLPLLMQTWRMHTSSQQQRSLTRP